MDEALQQAVNAHNSGRFEEARKGYSDLLSQHPDHPHLHYLMGQSCWALRDVEQAESYTKRAIDLDGTLATYHASLAQILMRVHDFESAIGPYSKAVELDPKQTQYAFGLTQAYVEAHHFGEAKQWLEALLEQNPNSAEAHMLLARWYALSKEFDKAQELYEKLHASITDHYELLCDYGEFLIWAGNLEQAEQLLTRAHDLKPQISTAHRLLGKVFWETERKFWTVSACESAIQRDPTNRTNHLARAYAKSGLEAFDDALESFAKATALRPLIADCYQDYARTALRVQNIALAIDCLEKRLSIHPEDYEARKLLGSILHLSGKAEEGRQHLHKALTDNTISTLKAQNSNS